MRKTVLMLVFVALTVVCLAATASAVVYTCEINGVGVDGANYYVILTDDPGGTFVKSYFWLNGTADQIQKLFATALSAIGSQYRVYANVDTTTIPPSIILSDPDFAGLDVIGDDF